MSKWGEGTGTAMSSCTNPNKPSFDPASHLDKTTEKLNWLCTNAWDRMTKWEQDFCKRVYGQSPLTRKVHIRVSVLHKIYLPDKD